MGVETYHYASSSKGKQYATAIQDNLVKTVGWKNRGVKTGNFYVLKNTKAPAVLIELGFCDSKADMDLWNTETICKAIFKAITGSEYVNNKPIPSDNPIYRVVIDGKQIGSYRDINNVINQIRNSIANSKKVEITRV